jgi:cardiolipin synthase
MNKHFSREGYTIRNRVTLVRGGRAYFEQLKALIRNARESIHLQMYIFNEDETGQEILQELITAAGRGVAIFLLLDGYASQQLSRKLIHEIKEAGINFRWFEPLLRSRYFYFGRRLHHKIVVADAEVSLVGGLNIGNRYNDFPGQKAWLDWAVLANGEVTEKLFLLCQELWNKSGWGKKKWQRVFLQPETVLPDNECMVRVRREDWVRRKSEISSSYMQMLRQSRSEVVMMSSYFLPGRQIRKSLAQAAKRGVQVSIITTGKSDVQMAKHAERYLYRWMLARNIKVFEYQENILHGKISCADGQLTTIGSYNVNFLSAFASIELNLDILDEKFGYDVHLQLQEIIAKECIPITAVEWQQHYRFWERVWQRICYDLIRLAFYLFTFYFRQHK